MLFAKLAADRRARNEWSASDEREIGLQIGEAIRTGTPAAIAGYAEWLEECAWAVLERQIREYQEERAKMVAVSPVLSDEYESREADREWKRRQTL